MWALVVAINIKSFEYLSQRLSRKNYALDKKYYRLVISTSALKDQRELR